LVVNVFLIFNFSQNKFMIVETSLSNRTYAGDADLQAMIDLLVAVRPAERLTDYPGVVDLHELLALPEVQANTRLWFATNGQIAAFAFVDSYQNLRFEFNQLASAANVESDIIAWGISCIQRTMQERGETLTLDTSCREDDIERLALLARHGFVPEDIKSLHMVRSLHEPIPVPQLPAGFTIRPVAGEHEAEALVTLHQAAFGTNNMTVAERLAMMRVPVYDLELDLLVIAPDGRLAAYCMCSISEQENERTGRKEGYTDPIATHPDYQRLGLAKALLLTGLHELKRRGMETAVLGTSSHNIAMQRTAESVGFQVQSTKLWFAKQI
jgi:mycothiol synthase